MKSAVFEGVVTHRRHATDDTARVEHGFHYPVAMTYLFLDEIDEFFSLHPLWSSRHAAPVHFRRRDYLGDPSLALDDAVRDVVLAQLGKRPSGPVAMLGHLRTWGWLFNPLTVYYCFDESGERVEAVVLEVTSTPWHERHVYVIDANVSHPRFAKEMHVSPFLGMDHDYVMEWTTPGEQLKVRLGNRKGDVRLFDAALTLRRRGAQRRDLARLVWRRPFQTYGVSLRIYTQALRLLRKGAKFHPRRPAVVAERTPATSLAARD
jgi:uncharacterized protein